VRLRVDQLRFGGTGKIDREVAAAAQLV